MFWGGPICAEILVATVSMAVGMARGTGVYSEDEEFSQKNSRLTTKAGLTNTTVS